MWECAVCHHVELGIEAPSKCPVCDAPQEKFIPYESKLVKGTRTLQNLKAGFIGEAQAHQRNLAFAMKAEEEELPQIAKLFRAIAEAEAVHAFNHLRFLGVVKDTQSNLETAFERETMAEVKMYPQFIKEAEEEGSPGVALTFSRARDVEREHARLYKKALDHLIAERETTYYVCSVCGYVSDGILPDECPICGAGKDKFRKV
jgi:rubrerythrin